ncbi:ADP-heptose--lipooligosaccharide heptosyltransferase II [hydrothermal vent metagenome]|uniref:lipopolysaccharide heptosyltransferase II n=1 Tax=hydrothermal vent metagenome TaxID=652676 RepID=A0A3B0ZSR4_9ZZZZ
MTRLLVVGPSWVGDMVLAQSLFIALQKQDPALRIDVLAPAWTHPLLARMPEVQKALIMPLGHGRLALGQRYQIGRELRSKAYDRAIVLPNSFKSALIPFWANIKKRTGYKGELRWGLLNDVRHLDKQRLRMTVQRFVALADPSDRKTIPETPLPQLSVEPLSVQRSLQALRMEQPEIRVLGLCPGAEYGPAKCWPIKYYAEVAKQMRAKGWVVWIFGSEKDKAAADEICHTADEGIHNLAGQTSLGQAIDLLSLCNVVISNDSGLMHVAAALNRPLVAIYGSSDPGFTPPMHDQAKIVQQPMDCQPCFKRTCPLEHTQCLTTISPQRVMAEVAALYP